MHRYRIPATVAVAALALIALLGATRLPASANGRAKGTKALARPSGAPYLTFEGPDGGDVRMKNMARDIRQQAIEDFLAQAKANADAQAQREAAAQQEAARQEAARQEAARQQAARQQAYRHRSYSNTSSSSHQSGSSTGGACGGDLPPCCVMNRESRGNPQAVNESSGAAGKWQFMPGTWNNYGGYSSASQAPESVQDAKARQVYAGGAGASNWAGDGC